MSLDQPEDPASVYLTEVDAAILTCVVAHPFELPTLREVCFAAGEFEESLVHRRVEELVGWGLLEPVEFGGPPPDVDGPTTFYGTTAFGASVLDRRLPRERVRRLAEEYALVEKPPEIRDCERAPRPSR